MLGEVFYWVLNMSISAAIVGVIVLLLCRIRRLPRRLACFLWVIPFARMTVPFGVNSRYSLMTLLSKCVLKTVSAPGFYWDAEQISQMNFVMAAKQYAPLSFKVNALAGVFAVAGAVWLVGVAVLLLLFAVLYIITVSELKGATHLRDNMYCSGKITSPAVYGILRPRILLPDGYTEQDLPYILAHERQHIRRADNLRRVLAFAVTAAHWFNPLAWLFLREYLAATELACDEGVLAGYDGEERRAYARTLVNAAASREVFASAFGGAKVRVRVTRILSYKKLSFGSACACAALAAAMLCVLLTNAA